MCSKQERQILYDLILESHYDLMQYFYFNQNTENGGADGKKMEAALKLLKPATQDSR
jgi:hypothetical protein